MRDTTVGETKELLKYIHFWFHCMVYDPPELGLMSSVIIIIIGEYSICYVFCAEVELSKAVNAHTNVSVLTFFPPSPSKN